MSTSQLDIDKIEQRYAEERAKRLRDDGNAQYIRMEGEFAHFNDDPHSPPIARDPVSDDVDVAILGAGFGGLTAGARMRELGLEKVRMIEKAGDVGGVWYWNRYPGAQCDVESYIYLPFLEETGYIPTEKYVYGPEIREHAQRIATHFDLYQHALFQTVVTEMRWQETDKRWRVTTNRGDVFNARMVFTASGSLTNPKLPGLPGIADFKGHTFHTSRWDFDYSGGDTLGGLEKLKDKCVGIIGTGATALQVVPHLSSCAKETFVFQRTPANVGVRGNLPTPPDFADSLEPGWQQQRMENFNNITYGQQEKVDLVRDGWTKLMYYLAKEIAKVEAPEKLTWKDFQHLRGLADHRLVEESRARIDEEVNDPETAEALKPWYRFHCKRASFHDQYLQSFNTPSTHLVDTAGRGVERVTANGVVVNGREYPLDCLIFATGFEVGLGLTQRTGCDIIGRDGVSLTDHWSAGMRTLHSYMTDGFPNMFILSEPQGGLPFNWTHLLLEMSAHVQFIVRHLLAGNQQTVEPETRAVDEWVAEILTGWPQVKQAHAACTPSYYNGEGTISEAEGQPRIAGITYIKGPHKFYQLTKAWRQAGDYAGLKFG